MSAFVQSYSQSHVCHSNDQIYTNETTPPTPKSLPNSARVLLPVPHHHILTHSNKSDVEDSTKSSIASPKWLLDSPLKSKLTFWFRTRRRKQKWSCPKEIRVFKQISWRLGWLWDHWHGIYGWCQWCRNWYITNRALHGCCSGWRVTWWWICWHANWHWKVTLRKAHLES